MILYVTGSEKTRLLEQAKMLVINVSNDRVKHCLRNDMLSVSIPTFIPELCVLETRSCEIEVLKTPLKYCSIRKNKVRAKV